MIEFKNCIRCKSSDIQIDYQPANRVSVYCENCGIKTRTYESDNMQSIENAIEAAIEDWNTDY